MKYVNIHVCTQLFFYALFENTVLSNDQIFPVHLNAYCETIGIFYLGKEKHSLFFYNDIKFDLYYFSLQSNIS